MIRRSIHLGTTPFAKLFLRLPARVMKLDRELGTLEAGTSAHFLMLNADPLADIRNTRQIDSVWIAGRRLTTLN